MSDLTTLIDMGFDKERASYALEVTGNEGVQQAMEWLLVNNDPIPTSGGESNNDNNEEKNANETALDLAKSIKCEDCNRLFKTHEEIEFHAAKSGHSNFSESTEEKKPLTEEEKREKLAKLEEKIRQKRLEREEREKQEQLEREKNRIRSGKDILEMKRKIEDQEMLKLVAERKREKEDERLARERVKAQIEADRLARREKEKGNQSIELAEPSQSVSVSGSSSQPQKNYEKTRLQLRLMDGSTITESFDVKEQLAAVRLFVQMKQGVETQFRLMTNFPKKIFSEDDYEKSLTSLGLVPSAVLIVTKAS